jgi:hypothetical protein
MALPAWSRLPLFALAPAVVTRSRTEGLTHTSLRIAVSLLASRLSFNSESPSYRFFYPAHNEILYNKFLPEDPTTVPIACLVKIAQLGRQLGSHRALHRDSVPGGLSEAPIHT